jgi:hypothetical protein
MHLIFFIKQTQMKKKNPELETLQIVGIDRLYHNNKINIAKVFIFNFQI